MTNQQAPAIGHLAGQALHAMDRLHDHIARLDEGRAYAADDLAVVLRLLVGKGKGLNLLHRIARPGTGPIRFLATRAPETAETHFSFGLLPARDGSEPLGSTAVTLPEWLSSTFLSIRLGELQKNYTWERFISSYSNKWGGAHVDNRVPPELTIIDKFAFGGYALSSYFLRSAGVIVWKAAQVIWTDSQLQVESPIVV